MISRAITSNIWRASSTEFITQKPAPQRPPRQRSAAGRGLLERGRRRPPVSGPGRRRSSESPKRQVRLPQPPSNKLDDLARLQHRMPSELMRETVEEYVQEHST